MHPFVDGCLKIIMLLHHIRPSNKITTTWCEDYYMTHAKDDISEVIVMQCKSIDCNDDPVLFLVIAYMNALSIVE